MKRSEELRRQVARRNPEIMADYLADELGAAVRPLAWGLALEVIAAELRRRKSAIKELRHAADLGTAEIVREVQESLKTSLRIPSSARGLRIR